MIRLALILCILSMGLGCSPNRDIATPDGFLRVLGTNLAQGKSDLLYTHLSNKTKQNLKSCKELVLKIREKISNCPELFKGYRQQQEKLSLGVLQTLPLNTNELTILLKLIEDKWAWLQTQKEEKIEQGLNTRKILFRSDDQKTARLLTRSRETISLVMENSLWRLNNFDTTSTAYVKTLQKNLKTLEQNLKEIRYRKQYNLALPTVAE
jgi:hypothetical protein